MNSKTFRDPDNLIDESTNPSNGWRAPVEVKITEGENKTDTEERISLTKKQIDERSELTKANPNERIYTCFICLRRIEVGTRMVQIEKDKWVPVHSYHIHQEEKKNGNS